MVAITNNILRLFIFCPGNFSFKCLDTCIPQSPLKLKFIYVPRIF